jgi:hypothetical protein
VFSLKGKDIILSPILTHTDNCVYNKNVLKKLKFKESELYPHNILGENIHVLDVLHINKQKEKEAILLVLIYKNDTVVFYLPMHYKYTSNSLYMNYYSDFITIPKMFFVENYTSPKSIYINYYDASLLKDIENKYKENVVYPIKSEKSVKSSEYEINKHQKDEQEYYLYLQTPYIFKGFEFKNKKYREDEDVYKNLYAVFVHNNTIKNIPIGTGMLICINNGINKPHLYSDYPKILLSDFYTFFETEKDFILHSKAQYDSIFIENLREKYVGKEIHSNKNLGIRYNKIQGDAIIYRSNGIDDATGWVGGFHKCTDIKLMKSNNKMPYYRYFAILEDSSINEQCAFPITDNFESFFTFADIFRKEESEKKLKDEIKKAEIAAEIQAEETAYKTSLIKKYGKNNAALILNEDVRIGFTKQMCIESWGEPYDINTTITRHGKHEQWVYGDGTYLYFEGNILTGIQN